MSTISDQDIMSEGSSSPSSYTTLESPLSSPLQQVPQLTTTILSLSCREKNLHKSSKNDNTPFLRITEQPQNYFRFRYDTEKSGSTHGSILGKSYVENKTNKKTHPTVELVNYSGKAIIKCSVMYDHDKKIHKNIYKILEDKQTSKSYTVPKSKSYKVGFPGIGVHTIKKTVLANLLYNKLSELARNNSVDTLELQQHCDKLSKDIDQNIVRLKFSAHYVDSDKEICDPVLSDPILNKKNAATNALRICRMSQCSGRPSGGDDVFLLIDKIDKNDIKVRFYEEDMNGQQVWTAWGIFIPSDVHHQTAIVCRTPPYKDITTEDNGNVWIELVRPSNGSRSEPKEFVYKADPVYKQYKRRKPTPCTRSESIFSDESSLKQPVIVLPNDPNEKLVVSETLQSSLQQTSESEWNIISTSLDILENVPSQALELPEISSPMWSPCLLDSQLQPVEVGIAASAMPRHSELGVAVPLATSCSPELGISAMPAQPLSTLHSNDLVMEEDIMSLCLENALSEYAGLFDMSLDDLFQSEIEGNNLVGDSGRVKVEPSTSPPQTLSNEDAVTEENAVPRSQTDTEGVQVTEQSGDTNDTTSPGDTKILAMDNETSMGANPDPSKSADDGAMENVSAGTLENASSGAMENVSAGAVENASAGAMENSGSGAMENASAGAVKNASAGAMENSGSEAMENVSASKSTEVKTDVDCPALFTEKDAAEVKKLVRELCETIRDKKSSKSHAVRTKLERLFNIRLSNGDTFLHMTLFKNQRSFEALVKMIGSVKLPHLLDYANNRGETILHAAVIHGTPELVALLVEKGCDVNARNCEEESALHYAVRYAGYDTLCALLDAAERTGAPLDLDARNAEKASALHLCALHGRARSAALLGARGARCGLRDAAGRTALHLCAYDARVDVARALLPHVGTHIHARDGGGRTALAVACAHSPTTPTLVLVRALLAAGAYPEPAWKATQDHPALRDLLRKYMPPTLRGDRLESERDDDELLSELEEDFKSESDDADTDEYESADDEYLDASETPESLAHKLEKIELTDNTESS